MPTWLRNAKIDKVSLVPRGANRRQFTIFKQQTPSTPEKDMSDQTKELIASLASMDEATKAELQKALAMEPVDVFAKLEKATDEQKEALAKALGIEKLDDDTLGARVMKALGLTKANAEPDPAVPEAVRKIAAEMKETVAKAEADAKESQAKLDTALATIEKRDQEARNQQMVTKAATFSHMGSPDDLSKLLTDVDQKLGAEGLKAVEAVLAKGEEAFAQAKVFEEIGVTLRGDMTDSPIAKIDAIAEEIRKSDPKMTIEVARAEAWRRNPELFKNYQSGLSKRIRAAGEE